MDAGTVNWSIVGVLLIVFLIVGACGGFNQPKPDTKCVGGYVAVLLDDEYELTGDKC